MFGVRGRLRFGIRVSFSLSIQCRGTSKCLSCYYCYKSYSVMKLIHFVFQIPTATLNSIITHSFSFSCFSDFLKFNFNFLLEHFSVIKI